MGTGSKSGKEHDWKEGSKRNTPCENTEKHEGNILTDLRDRRRGLTVEELLIVLIDLKL